MQNSLNILALDSALSSCSAAVMRDGVILSEIFEKRVRGQAERLLPLCQKVCDDAGMLFGDMDRIAVTCGPGTFTGVRIGLAAAKGLALALDIPLVGVTTLEAVAQNTMQAGGRGRIAIAHDARRSEVYLQVFDLMNGAVLPVSDPVAVPLEAVETHLGQVTAVAGSGTELVKEYLSDTFIESLDFPDVAHHPRAGTVGLIAHERSAAMPDPVQPLYLRAPDAVAAEPIRYPFQNP